jgi:hypothetical protein
VKPIGSLGRAKETRLWVKVHLVKAFNLPNPGLGVQRQICVFHFPKFQGSRLSLYAILRSVDVIIPSENCEIR